LLTKRWVRETKKVAGKTFVLAGTLVRHSRAEAKKMFEDTGGIGQLENGLCCRGQRCGVEAR
jgi:NAD-dependent DNA ligase